MMKPLPLVLLVLLFCGIAVGGLAIFAADPLLYTVDKDPQVSVFHANPEVLRQRASNTTTDVLPLMQDILDEQGRVVAMYGSVILMRHTGTLLSMQTRRTSLQYTAGSLKLNGGEISSFLNGTTSQEAVLAELVNQTSAFDAVNRVAEREENRENSEAQTSVASQGEELKNTIRRIYDRYASDHEIVLNASVKLGLDTRRYEATRAELANLADVIEAVELPEPDPALLQESGITFYVEPEEAGYMGAVKVFGSSLPVE